MNVSSESYVRSAVENANAALVLWRDYRNYPLAHYVAGLAVESMLRGYAKRAGERFDARHDLQLWYRKARFDAIVPQSELPVVSAAFGRLVAQWNNAQRLYSNELLRSAFRAIGRDRGIKGDFVKELTSQAV